MNIKTQFDHLSHIAKLSLPALLAVTAPALMHIADTIVLSKLGNDTFMHALMVLPIVILLIQISASALGGAITTATAKASVHEGHEQVAAVIRSGLFASGLFATAFIVLFSLGTSPRLPWSKSWSLPDASYEYGLAFCLSATLMWISNALAASLRGFSDFKSTMQHSWIVLALYCLLGALVMRVAVHESEIVKLRLAAAALCLPYAFIFPIQLLALKRWCPLNELFSGAVFPSFPPLLRQAAVAAVAPLIASLTAQVVIATFTLPELRPAMPILGMGMRIEYVISILMFGLGTVALSVLARKLAQRAFTLASETIIAVLTLAVLVLSVIILPFFVNFDFLLNFLNWTNIDMMLVRPYVLFVIPTYYLYGTGLVLFFCLQAAQAPQFGVIATALRFAAVVVALLSAHSLNVLSATSVFQILGSSFILYWFLMLMFTHKTYAHKSSMQPMLKI